MFIARDFFQVVEHSIVGREINGSIPLTPFLRLISAYTYIPIRNVISIKKVIKACFVDVLGKKLKASNLYMDLNLFFIPVIMKVN